jgi:hypothetical protein
LWLRESGTDDATRIVKKLSLGWASLVLIFEVGSPEGIEVLRRLRTAGQSQLSPHRVDCVVAGEADELGHALELRRI